MKNFKCISGRFATVVFIAPLATACMSNRAYIEVLSPSEVVARANELDGKLVHVKGWVEIRGSWCIWDSKATMDRQSDDAGNTLLHSLSLFGITQSFVDKAGNRDATIDGTFYVDVAKGRVSTAMCNVMGIDLGNPTN